MTKLGDPLYWYGVFSQEMVAKFSPDNSKFIVVLRRGSLKGNTNEFSLLLWRSSDVLYSPPPDVLIRMSSSSNRPAIQAVKWLDDQRFLFLGEHPGELQQLYEFDLRTHKLRKLTNSSANILAYSASENGLIVYFAEQEPVQLFDDNTVRNGAVISSPMLLDNFIAGIRQEPWQADKHLFVQNGTGAPQRLLTEDPIQFGNGNNVPLLSPDGKYIVLLLWARDLPNSWAEYSDRFIQDEATQHRSSGQDSRLSRYVLLNTETGKSRVLYDGPVESWDTEILWAPDSRSVVIANAFLPLQDTEGDERQQRRNKRFAIEVRIDNSQITKISDQNMELLAWDGYTKRINFRIGRRSTTPKQGPIISFEKHSNTWERLSNSPPSIIRPAILLEEGMNSPPVIVVVDPVTRRHIVLLDLNPQFADLRFGKVEEVTWTGTDGHTSKGGLYYPTDYVPSDKYPLVIQTHGWTPTRFWIDGAFSTAFAAQPLAAKGFMVLQMAEYGADSNYDWYYSSYSTPKEASRALSSYEGAIDFLDSKGLIDRNRVGIIGFSRTCYYVKYTLTHSKYKFSAASITDGLDGGYLQYLAYNYASPKDMDGINGGFPFGQGLKSWMELSPGFRIDKVGTPVRIMALHPGASEWEWFAALSRLGKPVEMISLKDGEHALQKPSDRWVSLQGNVDWFSFWLKAEEDGSPEKTNQYVRWRELRRLATSHSE